MQIVNNFIFFYDSTTQKQSNALPEYNKKLLKVKSYSFYKILNNKML